MACPVFCMKGAKISPIWTISCQQGDLGRKVVELDWENCVDNELVENCWKNWDRVGLKIEDRQEDLGILF